MNSYPSFDSKESPYHAMCNRDSDTLYLGE